MRALIKYYPFLMQKPSAVPRIAKGFLLKRVFKKNILRGIELAVTYDCQASCEKCSCLSLMEAGRPEISLLQVKELMESFDRLGVFLVNITGGEPLLRKDIADIVRVVSKKKILASLSTNAQLLSEDLLTRFKMNGLNVLQVSMDSPCEREHDVSRGIPGLYRKVVSSVTWARKLSIEVLINTVVTPELLTLDRLDRMIDFARQHKSFLSLIMPARVGGWRNKIIRFHRDDLMRLEKLSQSPYVTTDRQTCFDKSCPAGREKLYINPYGDVYPCPFIQEKSGNLYQSGLESLWSGHYDSYQHDCCQR